MRKRSKLIRSDEDLVKMINQIRAMHILDGKTPPTTAQITKKIANSVNKKKLREAFKGDYISF